VCLGASRSFTSSFLDDGAADRSPASDESNTALNAADGGRPTQNTDTPPRRTLLLFRKARYSLLFSLAAVVVHS